MYEWQLFFVHTTSRKLRNNIEPEKIGDMVTPNPQDTLSRMQVDHLAGCVAKHCNSGRNEIEGVVDEKFVSKRVSTKYWYYDVDGQRGKL